MTPAHRLARLLGSVEMARAFTLAVLSAVFGAYAIEQMTSAVTLSTIIAVLCLLGAAILWVRREELSPLRIAPSSLLAFLGWALVSLVWTTDRSETLFGWMSLFGFAFLALAVGHVRDTLQTVRAIGDTLRVLLAVSLGVEILSGILLDVPFTFLGIQGNLAEGGPIQGIFGSRNMLGFIAVIALITFVIEWRTQSVNAPRAVASIALAGSLAFLSSSPTVLVLAAAVGVVTVALTLVRHASAERRNVVQWTLGILVAIALTVAFALRHQIIALLDAGSDFSIRGDLWNTILDFVALKPIQGWGWFGAWARGEYPFTYINFQLDDHHQSALNAFFDVLLQLGAAGLVLFLLLGGVALIRSWLVASVRRSVVYAWTPITLVTLAVDSMFESFTLVGAGWFLLVLCALRAGQSRSWRENIDAAQTGAIPTLRPQG
ncbi:O-antigen ligase family protein [Microbacterium sp. SSW1-49]|uniref:O-antigen ligase family protein n=1 Tax=Microbacterium croceum TaxID=2851645 RepID=A0ABT0FE52_9MICO|nr:O-antigen ligase family protein [Microbacterium croceum]MCK2036339.1 O-antigen ligase family protein [Microbacterium croceum]